MDVWTALLVACNLRQTMLKDNSDMLFEYCSVPTGTVELLVLYDSSTPIMPKNMESWTFALTHIPYMYIYIYIIDMYEYIGHH